MTKVSGSIDVDTYLGCVPKGQKTVLEDLREAIQTAAKGAEESIKYHIPTYKYKGWLVHFKAGKKFCSFITGSKDVITLFEKELEGFEISGTTIHFSKEKPIPKSLIKRIVKQRMRENDMLSKK